MLKFVLTAATIFSLSSVGFADEDHKPATEADVLAKARTIDMGCNDQESMSIEKIVNTFNYSYETSKDPKHTATFFVVTCIAGAYNESSAVFIDDEYEGLHVVPLATPVVNSKGKISGLVASLYVGGLSYDEKAKTLHSYSKGRGIGDMFAAGTYLIHESEILLRKYELDSTGDGKINPKVIFETKASLK